MHLLLGSLKPELSDFVDLIFPEILIGFRGLLNGRNIETHGTMQGKSILSIRTILYLCLVKKSR